MCGDWLFCKFVTANKKNIVNDLNIFSNIIKQKLFW